jgi:hypothetical protein
MSEVFDLGLVLRMLMMLSRFEIAPCDARVPQRGGRQIS